MHIDVTVCRGVLIEGYYSCMNCDQGDMNHKNIKTDLSTLHFKDFLFEISLIFNQECPTSFIFEHFISEIVTCNIINGQLKPYKKH